MTFGKDRALMLCQFPRHMNIVRFYTPATHRLFSENQRYAFFPRELISQSGLLIRAGKQDLPGKYVFYHFLAKVARFP